MVTLATLTAAADANRPISFTDSAALAARVKAEVDLREYLRPRLVDYEEYDRYIKTNCLNPDHDDANASMLIFHDGCRCQAGCGFRADAIDFYRMEHPSANFIEAATALLANPNIKFSGEVGAARELRSLDEDLGVRYHLELARSPAALAGLEAFGFTREAIQQFKLGLARPLVRLQESEADPDLPDLEWREVKGRQVPYQRQWRYSVPIFSRGRLVQIIYRKADPADPGPKTTLEKGAGTWLYNADALKSASAAVVTGGWGDSIACWHWGFVGVSSTAGDGHFSPDWVPLLGHVRKLYVVGDADNAGQKMMARVREHLPWAVQVQLPWELGSKRDLRDGLLAGWTREDFLKLLKAAEFRSRWEVLKRRP